jgi:hypothetical protein
MTASASPVIIRGLGGLPEPVALTEALKAVVAAHPYSASGELDLGSARAAADAEALWNRLMAFPPARREHAVRDLRPFECRLLAATARPRLMDNTARAVLALAVAHHPLPDAAALAWEAWLVGDGTEQAFRSAAGPLVAAAGTARRTWSLLLEGERPSDVAVALWRGQPAGLDDWAATPAVSLQRYPVFLNHVRRRLLEPGNLGVLDAREQSMVIAQWVALVVPAAERDAWYAVFLSETYRAHAASARGKRWPAAHAVCEAVLDRAGVPADGKPFWATVSPPAWEAFSLWLKDRELTAHLGGENDRVAFWRRYLVPMRRMETNSDGSVAFLHFDGWVAVQFVTSGRATFLFRELSARGWRRWSDVDLYNHVLHLRRSGHPSFLDSYEHRGFSETWQRTATGIVNAVLQLMKREQSASAGA